MADDELLERVRELRARGQSPKEIARALKVRPATVTPLIQRLAAAEPREKEVPLVGCWVNQGWSSSVRFTGHPEWPDAGGELFAQPQPAEPCLGSV
jgi:orotate phosphoribosyltransferase-like protein